MLNASDVKDKNIRLEAFKYRARVEYYDGRVVDCGLFESVDLAKRELAKYPRDIWEGYSVDHYRYREPDFNARKTERVSEPLHPDKPSGGRCFGRTLVGLVCR